ncbi:hypothetical protein V8E54_014974 [Elaphomyces granulatus]
MGKSLYCQDKSGITQDLELPLAGLGSSAYPVCDKSPLPLIRQVRYVHDFNTLKVEGEKRIIIIIYYQHVFAPGPTVDREARQEAQGQVDAATQRAIDSRADNQPPTTKKAYSRPPALWKNWCAEMRFPDGPLVNEGKFCLFFERVIEPYRIAPAPAPASKKRKRAPNEAAVPTRTLARDMSREAGLQWQQWKDGYGGNPPVEQLERDWRAQWRPEARMRQWFSRRKVIWDRLREIVNAGQTPDAAVDQLKQIRKGKSLHQLGKLLKQQRVQGHG